MATGSTTTAKRTLCLVDGGYPRAGERPILAPQAPRRYPHREFAEVRRA